MTDPLVITAAITGSVTSSKDTPNLPTRASDIVDAAVTSWHAGAAVIHLHGRDRDGVPTQDAEVYRELVEAIRDRGCDAVLNLSTGSAGGRAELDDRIGCLDLSPEMATLDCGSMNFGDERVFSNPFAFLRRAAEKMSSYGVLPELEVFDSGMISNARRLIAEGSIQGPGVWQLCLGVKGGAPADIDAFTHLLRRLPEGAFWGALGIGRHQLDINLFTLAAGGHVRTGLEDNIYFRRGELATSNAQLVERIVRFAEEYGRPVASPATARELLGLKKADSQPAMPDKQQKQQPSSTAG
jgi:3-keto-5-aminohexanoate cleavage enzyme